MRRQSGTAQAAPSVQRGTVKGDVQSSCRVGLEGDCVGHGGPERQAAGPQRELRLLKMAGLGGHSDQQLSRARRQGVKRVAVRDVQEEKLQDAARTPGQPGKLSTSSSRKRHRPRRSTGPGGGQAQEEHRPRRRASLGGGQAQEEHRPSGAQAQEEGKPRRRAGPGGAQAQWSTGPGGAQTQE